MRGLREQQERVICPRCREAVPTQYGRGGPRRVVAYHEKEPQRGVRVACDGSGMDTVEVAP